jgi:hypothetical protein
MTHRKAAPHRSNYPVAYGSVWAVANVLLNAIEDGEVPDADRIQQFRDLLTEADLAVNA